MVDQAAAHQVVAVPYPGRGHINPMMNFCKLMVSKRPDVHILVIVTEEWLGYLKSDESENESDFSTRVGIVTIPNVLPSEATRGSDHAGFYEAVEKKMEGPIEKVLNTLTVPIDLIIADSVLGWAVDVGRRRNIKVASFWSASVSRFLLVHHYDLVQKLLAGSEEERIEIPGITSIRKVDVPGNLQLVNRIIEAYVKAVSCAPKAECVIFGSLKELEAPAIHALKADLSCPIYTIGPAINYFKITQKQNPDKKPDYISWLDSQQERSVLYVSLGSFMSISSSQMDELAAGLEASGVRFLWATKNRTCQLNPELGMVVSWCDQMRVLCHSSVGGFLTHCGWNSTLETVFAGKPALTFPLGADQMLNSKMIVEDWGIGWRVKDRVDELVKSEDILMKVKRFMDMKCSERQVLDRASKELQARLLESVGEDGFTDGFNGFVSQMI